MSALVTGANIGRVLDDLAGRRPGLPMAVDCETTGLHPYKGDVLRGFSIAFSAYEDGIGPIRSYYVPVGYPEGNLSTSDVVRLCEAIRATQPLYVYHHAKFDLRFLRQLPMATDGGRFFPARDFYDTKIVAWLMDENMSTSLKDVAAFLWGEDQKDEQKAIKALIKERGGWDKLTATDTAEYGAKDAELTLRLYKHQQLYLNGWEPMLYGNPAESVERELKVQALLLRVEDNGIAVDPGGLEELRESAVKQCAEIEALFLERYSVNVNSPKQLAKLLYDELELDPGKVTPVKRKDFHHDERYGPGSGPVQRSVSKAALDKLKDHPVVQDVLRYRKLKKAATSYLVPLTAAICPDDRVHPTFWQHGTVTGRFSCSDPNLQTIPRADVLPGVRDVFVAGEGYELWEYDLQAAEKRVLASLVEGDEYKELIESGVDVHAMLAERVFGPDFTPLQRRYAKNLGYGFDYGLTSPVTAAKYIDGPNATKIAVKILDGLKEMYPQVVRLMRRSSKEAEQKGYIRINEDAWPGRFRRFVTESPKKPYPYTALNARIQGSIAELMKDVMLAVEPHLDALGARICLQVHDSLVIEVPEGLGQTVLNRLNIELAKIDPFRVAQKFDGKPWGEHE